MPSAEELVEKVKMYHTNLISDFQIIEQNNRNKVMQTTHSIQVQELDLVGIHHMNLMLSATIITPKKKRKWKKIFSRNGVADMRADLVKVLTTNLIYKL